MAQLLLELRQLTSISVDWRHLASIGVDYRRLTSIWLEMRISTLRVAAQAQNRDPYVLEHVLMENTNENAMEKMSANSIFPERYPMFPLGRSRQWVNRMSSFSKRWQG